MVPRRILPVKFEQLRVRAVFDNPSTVQHQNLIGPFDRRHAMRNRHNRQALQFDDRVNCTLHLCLALVVQRARGLVEDQDLGLADHGAGNGNTLLLATAQFCATGADVGVVLVRHVRNVGAQVGEFGRLGDLLIRRTHRHAVGNVVGNTSLEQRRLLGHNRGLTTPPREADALEGAHRRRGGETNIKISLLHVVEAQQQLENRGLAATGGTNERNVLPGLDRRCEVLKNNGIRAGGVREGHGVELGADLVEFRHVLRWVGAVHINIRDAVNQRKHLLRCARSMGNVGGRAGTTNAGRTQDERHRGRQHILEALITVFDQRAAVPERKSEGGEDNELSAARSQGTGDGDVLAGRLLQSNERRVLTLNVREHVVRVHCADVCRRLMHDTSCGFKVTLIALICSPCEEAMEKERRQRHGRHRAGAHQPHAPAVVQ
eukprot:PhM_4_TR10531/c0_g1_i1/m.49017